MKREELKCPYCGQPMKPGYLYAVSSSAPYWLPDGAKLDSLTVNKTAIEKCGGFPIGEVAPIAFLSKEKPVTYHCPSCRILITKDCG